MQLDVRSVVIISRLDIRTASQIRRASACSIFTQLSTLTEVLQVPSGCSHTEQSSFTYVD